MAFPVLAAVTGALAVGSLIAGESARQENKKALRIQRRIQERKARRERISQVRQGMIQRAQIIAAGAAGGAMESSAVQGGAANVQSQVASNISFVQEIEGMQQASQRRMERAQDYQALSGALGAGASLATSFATPKAPTTNVGTTD